MNSPAIRVRHLSVMMKLAAFSIPDDGKSGKSLGTHKIISRVLFIFISLFWNMVNLFVVHLKKKKIKI